MQKQNPKLRFSTDAFKLMKAASSDSIMDMLYVVGNRGYGVNARKILFVPQDKMKVHDLINDMGGFGAVLGIKQTSLDLIEAALPKKTPHSY